MTASAEHRCADRLALILKAKFPLTTRCCLLKTAFPVSGDFATVSTYLWTAPAAMVRFRLVIEPEDTGLVFAALYELEIGFHKQFGGC
ncbi:MAG TPA: hypothetical protein VK638_02435, partial [Edaphobacter sp.]|nr:hypothetical protein [Edaphobacter sp.]